MSKKQPSAPPRPAAAPPETAPVPSFFLDQKKTGWLVAALAAALYANSLAHGFVLDDGMLILDNAFTKKGIAGWGDLLTHDTFQGFFEEMKRTTTVYGSRYRPLTLMVFALFYQMFGDSPVPFHLLLVAAFAGTCLLIYRTFWLVFEKKFSTEKTAFLSAAAALLFAAHPVHTEVVNNIKSLDEVAALALGLAAINLGLRAFDRNNLRLSLLAGAIMFVGMLAKENVLTLLAVFPAILLLFRDAGFSSVLKKTWPLAAGVLMGIGLRASVIGAGMGEPTKELVNNPFVKMQDGRWVDFAPRERAASVLAGLWEDARLLVFPHPLTSDYYPRQLGMATFSDWRVWAAVAVFGWLLWLTFSAFLPIGRRAFEKTRPATRLGAVMLLAPLSITSNIFFQIGTHLAERFLFMPSAGYCLMAAALAWFFYKKGWAKAVLGGLAVVLLLFSGKTVHRNTFWGSNRSLFYEDIKVSRNSVKMREAIAPLLLGDAMKEPDPARKQQLLAEAIGHLDTALAMHPTMVQAYYDRGNAHQIAEDYEAAIPDYRKALDLDPSFASAKNNLTLALREAAKQEALKDKDADHRKIIAYLTESDRNSGGRDQGTTAMLAQAHLFVGEYREAVTYFERLLTMMPGNEQLINVLADACEKAGDQARAEQVRREKR